MLKNVDEGSKQSTHKMFQLSTFSPLLMHIRVCISYISSGCVSKTVNVYDDNKDDRINYIANTGRSEWKSSAYCITIGGFN